MKKYILLVLIAAALSGCGRAKIPYNDYSRFKTVEVYRDGWEVVDTDTGWSYFVFSGGGMVPLFDEYGHTYRANGWRDIGS